MVEIHSTVGKRAKIMPDATVETTNGLACELESVNTHTGDVNKRHDS